MKKRSGRILTRYWDDDLAEYRFRLYEGSADKYQIDFDLELVADGDEAWAVRQSKHYNLEIEDE